jgi:hypothetical protein
VVSATPQQLYPRERDRCGQCGRVLAHRKFLVPTVDRVPDHPGSSKSAFINTDPFVILHVYLSLPLSPSFLVPDHVRPLSFLAYFVSFEMLTVMLIKIQGVWDVILLGLHKSASWRQ